MSALAQWLAPGAEADQAEIQKAFTPEQLEKFRRYHWRQYFLSIRRGDDLKAGQHREIAEELERRSPPGRSAKTDAVQPRSGETTFRTPSTLLINREHVRKFLLDFAKQHRAHKFSRVSEETLRLANEMLRQWCIGHVNRMPSKGQTL